MMQQATAAVIGSGMGGLATAEVLSKFFDHVLVVEKDKPHPAWGQSASDMSKQLADARPGVAQGCKELDKIFEGRFCPALATRGANITNLYESYIVFHPDSGLMPWLRNNEAEKEPAMVVGGTRHLLETTTRQLVADNPRVEFVYGAAVSSLSFSKEMSHHDGGGDKAAAVNGVVLADGRHLSAQLVVDCSGRGSSLPTWLKAAGYDRPRTSRASSNCGYVSWLCQLAPEVDAILKDCHACTVIALAAAPVPTFSFTQRVEGGAYLVSIGGNDHIHPGHTQQEELMQFAVEKVWHPAVGRLLAGSKPLTPAVPCSNVSSTWRHYEEVSLPDGLMVLGDSICSFSPVYGQGMTVAATEAAVLGQLLAQRAVKVPTTCPSNTSSTSTSTSSKTVPAEAAAAAAGGGDDDGGDVAGGNHNGCGSDMEWLRGLGGEFLLAALPTVKSAWQLAVGNDMSYATAVSNEPRGGMDRIVFSYVRSMFKVAAADKTVNEALHRSINMLDGPQALLHPALMIRVLFWHMANLLPAFIQRLQAVTAGWLLGIASGRGFADSAAATSAPMGANRRSSEPPALLQLLGAISSKDA